MQVIVNGEKYACARAVKGADYIQLYDAHGAVTVEFSGISDFSGYSISGGDWKNPAPTVDARLAALESLLQGAPSVQELIEALNLLLEA